MVVFGYYSRSDIPPAPYIRMQLRLPTLGAAAEIDFLIDTGADTTTLLPSDIAKLGIVVVAIPGHSEKASGTGGEASFKSVPASLEFDDPAAIGGKRQFEIGIDIPTRRKKGIEHLPSVLGRDILNQMRGTFDANNDRITLEGR